MSLDTRTTLLRKSAHAFCQALIAPPAPPSLISQYFTADPKISEHGPSWATKALPFLGKTFSGKEECVEYFGLLSKTLKMHLSKDSFPSPEQFIVDAEAGRVSVVGKGRFESVETGKMWDEEFAYCLSAWNEEGKLGHWEIWADPLSAWVAVKGDPEGLMDN